jgi:uncharacterized protein
MEERFILGTVQFGLPYGINNTVGRPDQQTVYDILDLAFDKGILQLDSADAYGDAQQKIGGYMQVAGKRFRVNGKFRLDGKTSIEEQLQATLQQLGLPALNTYFYHRFEEMQINPGSLKQLARLKDQGRISSIGVSVYTNRELESSIESPHVDVIQLPFNLLDNASKRGALLKYAKERNKVVQVRSVFLQGLFFRSPDSFPAKLQPLSKYIKLLRELAEDNGLSMFDLALGYALNTAEVDQVIIGVDSKQQLMENLRVLSGKLATGLVQEIDAIQVVEDELLYPYNWS